MKKTNTLLLTAALGSMVATSHSAISLDEIGAILNEIKRIGTAEDIKKALKNVPFHREEEVPTVGDILSAESTLTTAKQKVLDEEAIIQICKDILNRAYLIHTQENTEEQKLQYNKLEKFVGLGGPLKTYSNKFIEGDFSIKIKSILGATLAVIKKLKPKPQSWWQLLGG